VEEEEGMTLKTLRRSCDFKVQWISKKSGAQYPEGDPRQQKNPTETQDDDDNNQRQPTMLIGQKNQKK